MNGLNHRRERHVVGQCQCRNALQRQWPRDFRRECAQRSWNGKDHRCGLTGGQAIPESSQRCRAPRPGQAGTTTIRAVESNANRWPSLREILMRWQSRRVLVVQEESNLEMPKHSGRILVRQGLSCWTEGLQLTRAQMLPYTCHPSLNKMTARRRLPFAARSKSHSFSTK